MSFPLAGNERVRDALTAAIAADRIPHAVLIYGEKGTGRHTLARFLSRAAVCGGENPPCGVCRGCRLAESGAHPDVITALPEAGKKNISVSQIRRIRSEAYVKPHMADRRVFIIDGAGTMNAEAQNALLKVLEEPPGSVVFILIAESAAELLDTVVSRCTAVSLVPPEISEAAEYIGRTSDYGGPRIISALEQTGGNIGAALELLSGGSAAARSAAERFAAYLLAPDEAEMLKITARFEKSRTEADLFLKELKLCVAREARKRASDVAAAKKLISFYGELSRFEASLKLNINLSLLFCALVCRAAGLNQI